MEKQRNNQQQATIFARNIFWVERRAKDGIHIAPDTARTLAYTNARTKRTNAIAHSSAMAWIFMSANSCRTIYFASMVTNSFSLIFVFWRCIASNSLFLYLSLSHPLLLLLLLFLFLYFRLSPLFPCKFFAQLFEMLLIYKTEYNDIIYYTLEEKIYMQCKSDISNLFLDILFVSLVLFSFEEFSKRMLLCRRLEGTLNSFENFKFERRITWIKKNHQSSCIWVEKNSNRKTMRMKKLQTRKSF